MRPAEPTVEADEPSSPPTPPPAPGNRGCLTRAGDLVVWVLTVSDFTDLVIISAPSALLPEIGDTLGFGSAANSQIAAAFTAATCVGKLISGGMIDLVGGRKTLLFGLSMISVSAVAISMCTSAAWIAGSYAVMGLCHSPVYPSQAYIVREQLPPRRYAGMFRWLGITSRTGSFVCMLGFSATLKFASWRTVLRVVACAGFLAALIVYKYARARPPTTGEPKPTGSGATVSGAVGISGAGADTGAPDADHYLRPAHPPFLRRVRNLFRHKWYCAAIVASVFVTGIVELTLLMTTYFNDTCHGVAHSTVPALAAGFPAGLLFSNLGPGYVYKHLHSYRHKRALCLSLQLLSVLSTACLLLVGDTVTTTTFMLASKVVLTFGIAFGVGLSWYIPIPTAGAALAPNDTGLCQSLVDGFGLLAAVVFQMITSSFLKEGGGGWKAVLFMSLVWNVAGMVMMNQFYIETEPLMAERPCAAGRRSQSNSTDSLLDGMGANWEDEGTLIGGYHKVSTLLDSQEDVQYDGAAPVTAEDDASGASTSVSNTVHARTAARRAS